MFTILPWQGLATFVRTEALASEDECLPEQPFHTDLWDSAFVYIYFLCKSKMVNDFSNNLNESEFDYGVDGYMFEPTLSGDDTSGHVNCEVSPAIPRRRLLS